MTRHIAVLAMTTWLLPACTSGPKEDSGAETDDTDGPPDTDEPDTGVAALIYLGGISTTEVEEGTTRYEFSSAWFGFGYFGYGEGGYVCRNVGTLDYEGEAPAGCPDCLWSFDLSGVNDSTGEGDLCERFDYGGSGALDGQVDYAWGFVAEYAYDYEGTPLVVEDGIMLYTTGWFLFAGNLPEYGWYPVSGGATSASFYRAAYREDGEPAEYAYFLE